MTKRKYRSKYEKAIAASLTKRKIKFEYEDLTLSYRQELPKAKCSVCHDSSTVYTEHTYTPDFSFPNGVIVEAKGKFDRDSRRKMLAVWKSNPTLDIRMAFMRDNYIYKGSKTRYSDWCKARGIQYTISTSIPKGWTR